MNQLQQLTKQFSAQRAVHVTMVIFAMASVANVKSFFIDADHDVVAAWAIGGALGLVLVSASIMLSQIDFDQERLTFWLVASITAAIALLSGTIQTLAYARHLDSKLTAVLLGYGLPICGEMLLAIAVSMFDLAHKRQRIRHVGGAAEAQIAQAIADALSDVDVSKVRKYAERRVDAIVRHQVDKVASMYLPAAIPNAPLNGTHGNEPVPEKSVIPNQMNGFGAATLPAANEARYRKIEERRHSILTLITESGPMSIAEIAEKLEGAAKEKTLRTDCNELAKEGRLQKEGTRWSLARYPSTEPTVQVNGHL